MKKSSVLFSLVFSILMVFPFPFGPLTVSATDLSSGSPPISSVEQRRASRDVYYKVEGPVSGPKAPRVTEASYPKEFEESRVVVWVVAQQHLYWGGFVVGGLFLVTVLEVIGLMGWGSGFPWHYENFAKEIFRLVVLALSIAAGLGGLLFISLMVLYPDFMTYLTNVFRPVFLVYGLLVVGFTLLTYSYYYSWEKMPHGLVKWLHASLGVIVNVMGVVLTMLGNAWSSFMLSPAGVTERGVFLDNIWHVLHTALWNPLNVHRIASHILLGAAVVGVYGAYRALTACSFEERQHYDWLSGVAFFCGVVALITMPFGGYWLFREIYSYRQQMGITNFGGLLAWLNVVLVTVMGLLFFAINYYLWQRIDTAGGTPRYGFMAKYVYTILALCMMVSITPHTIVMTPLELQQMGGQQHQVLGNFGVESAKMSATNIMIMVTLWSWVFWRRCCAQGLEQTMRPRDWFLVAAFLAGMINILGLGIYGYFIPANVRIGLQVPMVLTPISLFLLAWILGQVSIVSSNWSAQWGALSSRGYSIVIFVAFVVTWVMGLGGYQRSSTRLFWHINEVMRDQSPWAYTHSIGFATNMISLNALLFWFGMGLLFWMAKENHEGDYSSAGVGKEEVCHINR